MGPTPIERSADKSVQKDSFVCLTLLLQGHWTLNSNTKNAGRAFQNMKFLQTLALTLLFLYIPSNKIFVRWSTDNMLSLWIRNLPSYSHDRHIPKNKLEGHRMLAKHKTYSLEGPEWRRLSWPLKCHYLQTWLVYSEKGIDKVDHASKSFGAKVIMGRLGSMNVIHEMYYQQSVGMKCQKVFV